MPPKIKLPEDATLPVIQIALNSAHRNYRDSYPFISKILNGLNSNYPDEQGDEHAINNLVAQKIILNDGDTLTLSLKHLIEGPPKEKVYRGAPFLKPRQGDKSTLFRFRRFLEDCSDLNRGEVGALCDLVHSEFRGLFKLSPGSPCGFAISSLVKKGLIQKVDAPETWGTIYEILWHAIEALDGRAKVSIEIEGESTAIVV